MMSTQSLSTFNKKAVCLKQNQLAHLLMSTCRSRVTWLTEGAEVALKLLCLLSNITPLNGLHTEQAVERAKLLLSKGPRCSGPSRKLSNTSRWRWEV